MNISNQKFFVYQNQKSYCFFIFGKIKMMEKIVLKINIWPNNANALTPREICIYYTKQLWAKS